MKEKTKVYIFEFIAAPAHLWIWICARIVGWDFTFGPVEEFEEDERNKKI